MFISVQWRGHALAVALSLGLSPLSHSVFNICSLGLRLTQLFSTHRLIVCRFTQKVISAAVLIIHTIIIHLIIHYSKHCV